MTIQDRMGRFVEQMYASGVARPGDLRGCSIKEIAKVERKYSIVLPLSYRMFLCQMGHSAGKLGNCGEFDLSYIDALKLTEQEFNMWKRIRRKNPNYLSPNFPNHGLIFCVRLCHPCYWLIICEGQDDSPVIRFDYDFEPVRFEKTQESLLGFLEKLCRDAEHWIRLGKL